MLKVKCKSCSEMIGSGIERIYCPCGKVFVDPVQDEKFLCGWVAGNYEDNIELVREDGTPLSYQSGNTDKTE